MSQYGSRDKANAGWGYARILKAYYSGIALS
jgi:peptidoglycan hydrolase-like amidase